MPHLWPVVWIYKSCVNTCKALNRVSGTIFRLYKNVTYLFFYYLFFFFFFCLIKHFLIFFFLPVPSLSCSMGDLVPCPGIEPRPPALGVQRLGHWATREIPFFYYLNSGLIEAILWALSYITTPPPTLMTSKINRMVTNNKSNSNQNND